MKVKIYVGLDLYLNQQIVKVDFYSTDKAYLNPIEHSEQCFTANSAIDLYDLENKGVLNNLTNTIEICVNLCLENHEKYLQQTLDNIVKKCEPKLKEYFDD